MPPSARARSDSLRANSRSPRSSAANACSSVASVRRRSRRRCRCVSMAWFLGGGQGGVNRRASAKVLNATEALLVVPGVGSVAEATRDARDRRRRVIGAAPQHALLATARTARVIARRIPVVVLREPVFAPLQDVAGHVVQAKTVRRERAGRRGVCVAVVVAVEQVKGGVVVAR